MIQAVPLPRSVSSDPQLDAIKTPPHSEDAEQSLLGGLLFDNSAWDKIADVVSAADFYRGDHRLIFSHICKLIERSHPADVVTVAESLESNKELQGVGGIEYLGALNRNTAGAANIRRYAEIVRERAIMRRLAEVGI
ncbi:MAG: replicative DNA helicase, partial [Burkholderiales bacterium]|nr:replicative DNA helicase [Burkholderiales bacterium]